MADHEAWLELADLYISQQDWNRAAFCVEELILHSPFNHLYLQRYADIKYTQVVHIPEPCKANNASEQTMHPFIVQGGFENLEMARAYYAQAAKLNPKNARALYGLILVSRSCANRCFNV